VGVNRENKFLNNLREQHVTFMRCIERKDYGL
jgi:hypothetical protein